MTLNEKKMWCALKGPRYWKRNNASSGYTFTRKGSLTKAFINAIMEEPITRKEFLVNHGYDGQHGLLTSFFAGLRQAGIVELDTTTWKYSLGPNYDHWVAGLLNNI